MEQTVNLLLEEMSRYNIRKAEEYRVAWRRAVAERNYSDQEQLVLEMRESLRKANNAGATPHENERGSTL